MQTSSSDFYQTQWEEYYNQLAEAESVESPTTYNKNSDFLSLVHKNALKDKQDFLGLGGMDVSISYCTTYDYVNNYLSVHFFSRRAWCQWEHLCYPLLLPWEHLLMLLLWRQEF